MRVLHIITSLSTGGAERALFNLLSGGLGQVGETAVLSMTDEGSYGQHMRDLGISVYTLNMRRGWPSLSALVRLREIVSDFRPDLIQGWMYHGNLLASLAGKLAQGHPATLWNIRHSLDSIEKEKRLTRLVIRANRWLSSSADKILYNSRVSQAQHEAYGFAADRGMMIPNGFNMDELKADPGTRKAMRQALGIDDHEVVVGHVARFHPLKNHEGFLQAAVMLLQTHPDFSFLLVGRDVDLENPALSGIVPLNHRPKFRFLGERVDVGDVMQAMDIFCLSSTSEAFPNVLAEAMSLCKPCVATDVGDCRDILGNSGVAVPSGETRALAEALAWVMKQSPQKKAELGMNSRERIQNNYQITEIVRRYSELYKLFERSR